MADSDAIRVLTYLVLNPGSKISSIVSKTGMARHVVHRILVSAMSDGDAKKTGLKRGTRYYPG